MGLMKAILTDLMTKKFVRGEAGRDAREKIVKRGRLAEAMVRKKIRMSFVTEREWREYIMDGVERRWQSCRRCPLSKNSDVILGRGDVEPIFAVVGDVTTEYDLDRGRAYLGPEGSRLYKFFAFAGIDMNYAWVTRAVACRPPRDRRPKKEERVACQHRLWAELAVVKPTVLILLGKSSMRALEGVTRHDEVCDLRGLVPREMWPDAGEGRWRLRAVFLSHSPREIMEADTKVEKRVMIKELIRDLKKANRVVDYLVQRREA